MESFKLCLMLLVLESNHLLHCVKGIPATRWLVQLWCENIRGLRVAISDEGILFYRVETEQPTKEDKVLSC